MKPHRTRTGTYALLIMLPAFVTLIVSGSPLVPPAGAAETPTTAELLTQAGEMESSPPTTEPQAAATTTPTDSGVIGEVACIAKPWQIVPMVVTQVQDVVAGGQIRQTDQLIGVEQVAKPGSITVMMEPLYEGALDDLPRGSTCIANLYTSFHEAMQAPGVGGLQAFGLHALGAVGLVHALILRIQAVLMPFKILVFSGH